MTLDEILLENEKLRVELSACNHVMLKHLVYIDELEAEVDKLRPMTVVQETLIRKAEAESEKLRAALERMLLEFDFMVEGEIIPDVRNDVIFVEARAALSGDKQ